MTVIVGIVGSRGVLMGADSAVSDTYVKLTMGEPKIRDFDGTLVGYSGSITVGRAILRQIEQNQPLDIVHFIETTTLQRPMHGTSFLVIQNREIWEIEEGAAIRLQSNYGAIGSGMQYALGSLHRSAKDLDDLLLSLSAAEYFAPDVRGPMTILTA